MKFNVQIICLLLCFVSFSVFAIDNEPKKKLILTYFGPEARPTTGGMVNNIPFLESLGFSGMTIQTPESWLCMGEDYKVNRNEFDNSLKILDGKFNTFTDNFIAIFIDRPNDFFDDWSGVVNNWKIMAEVAKNHGFKGIFFDNEEYKQRVWNYPEDVQYKNKTLQQYRDQAQLRGQQIMQAVTEVWPEVVIINLHGPYLSENRPSSLTLNQAGAAYQYEMLAPFYVGMMTEMKPNSTLIDGGEVYQYRSIKDFQDSYTWRKFNIATSVQNSPNIPENLRSKWPEKNNISFGLYPYSWPDANRDKMDASIMRTALENALRTADSYVWYYFEQDKPEYFNGTLSQDWKDAISGAIQAANAVVDNQKPDRPNDLSLLSASQSSAEITWTASSDDQGVAGYDIFVDDAWAMRTSNTNSVIKGLNCNTSYSLRLRAYDAAYNYSDTSEIITIQTSDCSNEIPANLLKNPGFESATLTDGWTNDWGNSLLTTNSGRNGTHGLLVGPGEGGRAQILTSGFEIGNIYTLSAWAKITSEGSGGIIGAICKNAAGQRLGTFTSTDITNTESFEKKKVTFIIPENTARIEIYIWHIEGTPAVLLDDYELVSGAVPLSANVSYKPDGNFNIYPNPLDGHLLNVRTLGFSGNKVLNIYDMLGNSVFRKELKNSENQTISLENRVSKGSYVVQIMTEKSNISKLLIVR